MKTEKVNVEIRPRLGNEKNENPGVLIANKMIQDGWRVASFEHFSGECVVVNFEQEVSEEPVTPKDDSPPYIDPSEYEDGEAD